MLKKHFSLSVVQTDSLALDHWAVLKTRPLISVTIVQLKKKNYNANVLGRFLHKGIH